MTVAMDTMYIQLDTRGNNIEDVQLLPSGSAYSATMNAGVVPVYYNSLVWDIKTPNPESGDVLVIQLPMTYGAGSMLSIQVFYVTDPESKGITWLYPNQTDGGVWPFVFTYSDDINARAIAPQQDTPANKITYGACVTVDKRLRPYMSANITGTYYAFYGYYKTCFYNQIPIPNYLMALVIGDLEYTSLGDNTGVLAEPSITAAAVEEFSRLQAILDTTE